MCSRRNTLDSKRQHGNKRQHGEFTSDQLAGALLWLPLVKPAVVTSGRSITGKVKGVLKNTMQNSNLEGRSSSFESESEDGSASCSDESGSTGELQPEKNKKVGLFSRIKAGFRKGTQKVKGVVSWSRAMRHSLFLYFRVAWREASSAVPAANAET
jgi:hypothetical protein